MSDPRPDLSNWLSSDLGMTCELAKSISNVQSLCLAHGFTAQDCVGSAERLLTKIDDLRVSVEGTIEGAKKIQRDTQQ